ncbi:MAG: hypothetical protein AVDCRST_MAG64-2067, partial [uncultured Phycisphaerae bacterium]
VGQRGTRPADVPGRHRRRGGGVRGVPAGGAGQRQAPPRRQGRRRRARRRPGGRRHGRRLPPRRGRVRCVRQVARVLPRARRRHALRARRHLHPQEGAAEVEVEGAPLPETRRPLRHGWRGRQGPRPPPAAALRDRRRRRRAHHGRPLPRPRRRHPRRRRRAGARGL